MITSFCSLIFLGFFMPAAALAYAVMPRRARPPLLLLASFACFWLISGKLLVLLVVCTLVTYGAGLGLGVVRTRTRAAVASGALTRREAKARSRTQMRLVVAAAVLVNLGILVAVKYLGFLSEITQGLLGLVGIESTLVPPVIGMPIGISFYTLQAISYLIDIYRGTISPERNLLKLALFMSFFPQLMEGPICRYADMAPQLSAGAPVTAAHVTSGTLRIAWGAAKILIVADRVNLFVKPVFEHPGQWGGTAIAMGAMLYTLQLYCDFSGTMDIVLGCGRIFGIQLPENFRQPFFSRTASEFWQRWHITLGAWLRDYVFYPVSLSRPVKRFARVAREHLGARTGSVLSGGVALFAVWLANGLWHGAGWRYIAFGMYYFVIILASGLLEPVFARLRNTLHIKPSSRPWIVLCVLRTWCIVFVGELIFRANGLRAGIQMLSTLVTDFSPAALVNGSLLAPGMDLADFAVVGIFVVLLFAVSLRRERTEAKAPEDASATTEPQGNSARAATNASNGPAHNTSQTTCDTGTPTSAAAPGYAVASTSPASSAEPLTSRALTLRIAGVLALVLCIVVFGAYGSGYIPLDPIYAQF